jgi:hypothetical protein
MSDLKIKFIKKRDGSIVSRFERADGTATWHRKEGHNAWFFVAHDLTHYAVETILGYRRGFYGLVVEGWDLADFGTPWPRGPLPADAEPAELLAGYLDLERASLSEWPADEFNAKAALYYATHNLDNPPVLDDQQLREIRDRVRELHIRWGRLLEGETLELSFDRNKLE